MEGGTGSAAQQSYLYSTLNGLKGVGLRASAMRFELVSFVLQVNPVTGLNISTIIGMISFIKITHIFMSTTLFLKSHYLHKIFD